MKQTQLKLVVTGVLLLFSYMALAQQTLSKFYVSGALGYSDTGWDYADYNSTGLGLNLAVGYNYNSQLSFEAAYTHFAKATRANSSISTNGISTFAKVFLPLNTRNFKLFAKLGVANLFESGEASNSHLGLAFAYGVDYPIKPNLSVEGQYTHYIGQYTSGPVPNADLYSVGVKYQLPQRIFM